MQIPSPIRLSAPNEDISLERLQTIVERFFSLNQVRLQRIYEFLLPEQRIFLDLLPLLFHQNSPDLPGFTSVETVSGISNYKPSHHTLRQAAIFSEQFQSLESNSGSAAIQGLYLMGSASSVAFSKQSDIDIWLCHESNLWPNQIDELQDKATAIEVWAELLELEVHFFLVDSQAYTKGALSPDSRAQTQHYLLLDEFYSTALYIAGRIPAWWLVPPSEEQNYTYYLQSLKTNQLIKTTDIIDFGGLTDIPAEEFVTGTLWHLYKSMSAPYKSLLKLLLMECYASEYPNPKWLCIKSKELIYNGVFSLERLDPYVLLYHKVEQYLRAENDTHRLSFARECFYFKVMGDMEEHINPKKLSYRKATVAYMEKIYQWPEDTLVRFSENKSWNIQCARIENYVVMRELELCYQMICHFANIHASLSENQDIQPIGRKLKFFLQKRPGKIDFITTRSAVRIKENTLTLIESPYSSVRSAWDLFMGEVPDQSPKSELPFKQGARSLVELLTWVVSNSLYHEKLNLKIHALYSSITIIDIEHVLNTLNQFLSQHRLGHQTELPAFRQPSRVIAHLLLLNLGDDGEVKPEIEKLIFNDYSDILSYGIKKNSFVEAIDQVLISSWGEVTCRRYIGLEGLFDSFIACFNQHSESLPVRIECYTPIHGRSIAKGIKHLFVKLCELFDQQQGEGAPRLVISGESNFYIFQQKEFFLHYKKVSDLAALELELAEAQMSFNTVHFHNTTLSDTLLPFIYSFAKPKTIHVFCYAHGEQMTLYIVDEKGSLFSQLYCDTSTQQLLNAYSYFLETLYDSGILESALTIDYYELFYASQGQYHVRSIMPPPAFTWNYLDIRIAGEMYGERPEILYSIYCDELEFSSSNVNEDVFQSVANYIYQIRKNADEYPIHITEIDVPLQVLGVNNYQQLQSIHFLRYKQKIENLLNSAVREER